MKNTETIDKIFLELSQFTKAKTKNEIRLEKQNKKLFDFIFCIAFCDEEAITVSEIIDKCRKLQSDITKENERNKLKILTGKLYKKIKK